LGEHSKITSSHRFDMMRSILIGCNTVIAGIATQFWTHGYVHKKNNSRYRVDGEIKIGDNVYIGSNSIINAGLMINNNITVGSNSVVSKSLKDEGLYVSQPLRYINVDFDKKTKTLKKITNDKLVEQVYEKEI